MRLYILDNGTIEGSGSIFHRTGAEAKERVVFPVSMYLICLDDGRKILFDAGVHPSIRKADCVAAMRAAASCRLWERAR